MWIGIKFVTRYEFNHKIEVETGIRKEECDKILKEFFKKLRKTKKKEQK